MSLAGLARTVREGCILEEHASIAHTVGLKQTILFPFVTLGSLINFCDCLMAGGTGPKDHSEVGSSYIHFNFTPNQDKATPSLIGDVPRGVMLNQRPIFLGGQGGMVGPLRLNYGITVAAGTILRKDELRPDRLIIGGGGRAATQLRRKVGKQLAALFNEKSDRPFHDPISPQKWCSYVSGRYRQLLWRFVKHSPQRGRRFRRRFRWR